jgi:tetratricopeptide (TPR) repeat protein
MDEATAMWNAGARDHAIALLRRVIAVEAAVIGPESVAVGCARVQLGAYLLVDAQFGEAEAELDQGARRLAQEPDRRREVVAVEALRADLYLKTGRPELARALLINALPAGEREFGPCSVEVVRLLLALGAAEEALSDVAMSEHAYRRALAVCEPQERSAAHADLIPVILASLVRVAFWTGKPGTGHEYLERLLAQISD